LSSAGERPSARHAAVPAAGASALQSCRELFGDRFVLADDVLAVALANVNPIAHAADAA
jgi:opine dehydrogenase